VPVLTNTTPLDESLASEQAWLAHLQGNILRGHGRDHALHIFFAFVADAEAVKVTLQQLEATYVTSALQQYIETRRYKVLGIPGRLFGNLFLTARGYTELGLKPEKIFERPDPAWPHPPSTTASFLGGLKRASKEFRDPPPDEWEAGFQHEVHGMLLLADDDDHELTRSLGPALEMLERTCRVLTVQSGRVIRNAAGLGIEHFGFVDGRSQPAYLATEFNHPTYPTAEADLELINRWNPFEPLERVLVHDPGVPKRPDCLGSFVVFRKLEQNVREFRTALRSLAGQIGLAGPDIDRAGAMVVGRFEDGTPLVLQKEAGWHPQNANNFDFSTDPRGRQCPLHAHIRKVNPRGRTPAPASLSAIANAVGRAVGERARRITRRSLPYGDYVSLNEPLDKLPIGGVGVLFICFQARISEQFGFIQAKWANAVGSPEADGGVDALVGQERRPADFDRSWPDRYNHSTRVDARFERFIRLKGGEFMFAPSLPFFEELIPTSSRKARRPLDVQPRPSGVVR
jgi:Dyp-type peroxidase family